MCFEPSQLVFSRSTLFPERWCLEAPWEVVERLSDRLRKAGTGCVLYYHPACRLAALEFLNGTEPENVRQLLIADEKSSVSGRSAANPPAVVIGATSPASKVNDTAYVGKL